MGLHSWQSVLPARDYSGGVSPRMRDLWWRELITSATYSPVRNPGPLVMDGHYRIGVDWLSASVWRSEDWLVGCWRFCILATSKVISRMVQTCDSAHSWLHYKTIRLGNQAAGMMIWFSSNFHYLHTHWTSLGPIILMPSTWLVGNKFPFYKSYCLFVVVLHPSNI